MNWQDLKQFSFAEIISWAEPQTWAEAMAACQQDAEWHAEGDVWTHTKMVCRQLQLLEEWNELSRDEQMVLLFVALFHDSAKPLTTQVDSQTGRVTSPKHAVKGEFLARNVLRNLACDLETREQIARLVRYHGRPAFLLERDNPEFELIRMSYLVENRLLYLFAIADTRGRTTESMSRAEETLHFWKIQATELDCFEQPYPFGNDHAKFLYFRKNSEGNQNGDRHYLPHEVFSCRATIVCGLPGAGKDFWIRQNSSGRPVVSLDVIRDQLGIAPSDNQGKVIQHAREKCREHLRAGTSFVFNATNTIRQTRSNWINLFADYDAQIKIIYIEPPIKKLLEQNRRRDDPVPDSVIHKLAEKCEPPTQIEAHQVELL